MPDDDDMAPFGLVIAYFDMLALRWLDPSQRPSGTTTDDFDEFIEFTKDVANELIDFGDRQRLEITPLLRFVRAVEERCCWIDVDEQSVWDAFERIIVRSESLDKEDSGSADNEERQFEPTPDNPDVRDLCFLLRANRNKIESGEKTLIDIARGFTGESTGNDSKAQGLLRQARRFPRIWKRADN